MSLRQPVVPPTPAHLARPGAVCPCCDAGVAPGEVPEICRACGGTAWLTAERVAALVRLERQAGGALAGYQAPPRPEPVLRANGTARTRGYVNVNGTMMNGVLVSVLGEARAGGWEVLTRDVRSRGVWLVLPASALTPLT